MHIQLRRDVEVPLYRQLHDSIASSVRSGELAPGAKLPSVRALARELGVSLITVVQAYNVLASDGLVHASAGTGTFVSRPHGAHVFDSHGSAPEQEEPEDTGWQAAIPVYLSAPRSSAMQSMLKPARRPGVISLASGSPDPTLFPIRALGRLWHRAMIADDPRTLQYGSPGGDLNLRAWIAGHCSELGIPSGPEDILITSGVQQAMDLVARTFVGPGDYVLVESPTFMTALDVIENRGVKLLGVPVDAEGMRVDVAAAMVDRFRPKLIYTIPTAQNPTGSTMTEPRRKLLAELARQRNLLVLEDDSCSEFTYDGEPPKAVKAFDSGGHVIFVKGFSKTVVPALRVGAVVAHGPLMARLTESKAIADRFTSPMIQRTLWRYLSAPQYGRDLETAKVVYRRRRDAALRALQTWMPAGVSWTVPDAGFNLWLSLPKPISASEAFEEALKERVACGPGDLMLPHDPPPNGLRISFADRQESVLEEGIKRLAAAISRLLSEEPALQQESEFVTAI